MDKAAASPRSRWWIAGVAASGLLLIAVWSRNYNLLGALYDYSIITSAVGWMHDGLKPYRDFTTPLQSLSIYAGDAAEAVFGPRYLALSYANLLVGLGYFAALLGLLAPLPRALRLLVAIALCVTSFFQHGSLWHNSLSISLLSLIVITGARAFRERPMRMPTAVMLCLLVFLSSMGKLNYHGLGLGFLGLMLGTYWLVEREKSASCLLLAGAVLVSGLILGPFVETLINGTSLRDLVHNVIVVPAGRMKDLRQLLEPNVYLDRVANHYPDNWSAGIFLKACLLYGVAAVAIVRPGWLGCDESTEQRPSRASVLIVLLLPVFFFASAVLAVTNGETQMLTSSFLLVGLVSACVMVTPELKTGPRRGVLTTVCVLGAWFAIAGSASAHRHSRLRFCENGVVGYYAAEQISPRLVPYFRGVRFTDVARQQLTAIDAWWMTNHLQGHAEKVYWGSGMEILHRVYGGTLQPGLPLWYHFDVSVRDADGERIVAALKQGGYEWVVAHKLDRIPAAEVAYFEKDFRRTEEGEVVFYHRKP